MITLIASGKKLTEILKHPIHHSLSTAENTATLFLKSTHQIVIKPADKRCTILVFSCDDYISEINRQLSDTTYYKELKDDPRPQFIQEFKDDIQSFLKQLRETLQTLPP